MGNEASEQIKRKLNRERLRALGVPEVLFEPAEYLTERGAFDVAPPRELVERTVALCLDELKSKPQVPASTVDPRELSWPIVRDCASWIANMGRFPAAYAEAPFYIASNDAPPVLIVENHNLLPPSFWRKEELADIRETFRQINTCARRLHRPNSCKVIILKDRPQEYTLTDWQEMASSFKEGTSDVYCISAREAGEFSMKEVVVVGDLRVMSMSSRPSSVHEAEEMLLKSKKEDTTEALALRTKIEALTEQAVPVKAGGVLVGEFADLVSTDDPTKKVMETLTRAAGAGA